MWSGKRCLLLAAVAQNGVIGCDRALPWHLPHDLRRFRNLTMQRTVAMGRYTYESLPPKKLPGRDVIVISRNTELTIPNARVAHSLKEAMVMPRLSMDLIVAGGGWLYKEAMPYAYRAVITRVYAEPEGDTFFPELDHDWCLESTPERKRFAGDEHDTACEMWVRHF
ncbi:MAG: dihydrofolate reductase [Parcubacteria group bacterium]|nr:dihydrofolate reductase [Parcubacteria group bacterium]